MKYFCFSLFILIFLPQNTEIPLFLFGLDDFHIFLFFFLPAKEINWCNFLKVPFKGGMKMAGNDDEGLHTFLNQTHL